MPGRPPWVRESGSSSSQQPPAWTIRKRSSIPAEPEPSSANSMEEQLASVRASLKKQNTVRPKPENGVADKDDDDDPEKPLVKPSSLKENREKRENANKSKSTNGDTKTNNDAKTKSTNSQTKTNNDAKTKSANSETKTKSTNDTKTDSDNKTKSTTNDDTTKKSNANDTPSAKKPPLAKQPSKDDVASKRPPILRQLSKEDGKKWRDPLLEKVKKNIDETIAANEIPKGHTLTKNESLRSLLKPVPPPMPPPMPPKLPPPPDFKKQQISTEKLKLLETLRSRPRRRPDWSDMMKEVESGRKLKHVVCNDRSSPIITKSSMVKAKGQYVYESEKENVHNQLLKQINQGVRLKQVKTNDRSRPNLEGLRKFRRQMTIEEQIQKSQSQANLAEVKESIPTPPQEEEEIDEMDDIDKIRDDLQSTKQLLALELRNKEAQQREIKRLHQRITNLENEMKSERAHEKQEQAKTVISVVDAYDENLVSSLKTEVSESKRVVDDLTKKYHRAAEERDDAQTELEELQRKNAELEKKLEQALKGIYDDKDDEGEPMSYFLQRTKDFERQNEVYMQGIVHSASSRRPSHAQKQQSIQKSSSEEEIEESSSDEGEDEEEKAKKKLTKELKMLGNKIRNLKEKKDRARKERVGLKVQLRNQQQALKEEKRKYKILKKEVDKMANLMKETDDENEDDDEEKSEASEEDEKKVEEEEEAEEEEEEETESESEDESEETESESEPEDAPLEKKKDNLSTRVKKHESSLSALKKGNYLIIANVDRLKDDINKQREMATTLQEDLDSVLAELE